MAKEKTEALVSLPGGSGAMVSTSMLAALMKQVPELSVEQREAQRIACIKAASINAQKARENAYPVFERGAPVIVNIALWRYSKARVVRDDGPSSDGERKITVEKVSRDERITIRRDRVSAVPA